VTVGGWPLPAETPGPAVSMEPGSYAWVVAQRAAGATWPQIARATGVPAGEAHRRWGRWTPRCRPGSPAALERAVAEAAGVAVPALGAGTVGLAAARRGDCPDCQAAPAWRPCPAHTPALVAVPTRGPRLDAGAAVTVHEPGQRGGPAGTVTAVVGWDSVAGVWVYRLDDARRVPRGPSIRCGLPVAVAVAGQVAMSG